MTKIYFLFCILVISISAQHNLNANALPCTVSLSADSIDFGTQFTGDESIKSIKVTNTSTTVITLDTIFLYSRWPVFTSLQSGDISMQPGQTINLTFTFKTPHNMIHAGNVLLRFTCSEMRYSLPLVLRGKAEFQDPEFAFTQNLEGQSLYNALNSYLNQSLMFSYTDARQFLYSKADNVNGMVECAYTGRKIQTTGIPNASVFNTEHSWPQSKGADVEPARSDIYHLYPTDAKANEKRSNHPYGIVARSISWESGGSKLGLPQSSADTVFEPRDIMKGNIARGILYFATRYGNRKGTFDNAGFLTNMETLIRAWNKQDPVDERERARGISIASAQKRMNPYIVYPDMIDRIFRLSTQPDFPLYPEPVTDGMGVFSKTIGTDSVIIHIPIINKGNQVLKINSTEFRPAITNARVLSMDSTIQPGSLMNIALMMRGTIENTTLLRIRFADGIPTLSIPISTQSSISSLKDLTMPSICVMPNPADEMGSQTILFTVPSREHCLVRLYDMQGKELFDYTDVVSWDGNIARLHIQHSNSNLIRLLCIQSAQFSESIILHTGQ